MPDMLAELKRTAGRFRDELAVYRAALASIPDRVLAECRAAVGRRREGEGMAPGPTEDESPVTDRLASSGDEPRDTNAEAGTTGEARRRDPI